MIIAASARFLAESAVIGDRQVCTVDGFADTEVRQLAHAALRVPLTEAGLDGEAVRRACRRLLRERSFAGAIVGAGLDGRPDMMAWLSAQLPVYGNRADVFSLCLDRARFARHLQHLGIPHPPEAQAPALLKQAGASGGAHIRFAERGQTYWAGTAVSHLFVAADGRITTVGWNTQWQSRHRTDRPFCYGGAVNRSTLSDTLRMQMEGYAARLAHSLDLVGVNSMDYMLCGSEVVLLELNPRASATMQLHEDETGALLAAHCAACRPSTHSSMSPVRLPKPQPPSAFAVLYAMRELVIPDGFAWGDRGDHVCDRPAAAARLAAGDAVCTLIVSAQASARDALTRLQHAIRRITARLDALTPQLHSTVVVPSGADTRVSCDPAGV